MTLRTLFAGRRPTGFSATELIVVCAILGILAAVSVPFFIRYYQSAALKAASSKRSTYNRVIICKQNLNDVAHAAGSLSNGKLITIKLPFPFSLLIP